MPKINFDEQAQIAEPIEFTLNGKEYAVKKISTPILAKVAELGKSNAIDGPIQQLALLVGVDPGEFAEVDIRSVGRALEFITVTIQDGIAKPKNSPGTATP